MKKLLLCILCSTIVTTFIGFTIIFIHSVPAFVSSEIFSNTDENSEILIEVFKNFEENYQLIENTAKEEKSIYGDDYPSGGKLLYYLMTLSSSSLIISTYLTTLLLGIILGTIIYIVCIRKTKGKKLIIETVLALVIIVIVLLLINLGYTTIFNILLHSIDQNTNSTTYDTYVYDLQGTNILIPFAGIFVLVYLVNMIYQKIAANRLNKALKKNI